MMQALLNKKSCIKQTKSRQEVSVMGTLVVGGILLLIVVLIVRNIVKDKKSGKSSCGGDCSHCRGCH